MSRKFVKRCYKENKKYCKNILFSPKSAKPQFPIKQHSISAHFPIKAIAIIFLMKRF